MVKRGRDSGVIILLVMIKLHFGLLKMIKNWFSILKIIKMMKVHFYYCKMYNLIPSLEKIQALSLLKTIQL